MAVQSVQAIVAPLKVEDNGSGGTTYRSAISTAGSTVAAVNLGHTGSSVVANGIPFVNAPGVSPSGATWSVVGSAVDDGLGNAGIDDLFFSEVWGLNPVRLTFNGLDPSHIYVVQILHGEPRNCCQGTFSNNTFSTDVDPALTVPVFTIGNGINGENPPAANDVAILTTEISGVTSFVYNAYSGVGRGGSIAGFQVRDLGLPNLVTTTDDSGPGSLRDTILSAVGGSRVDFDPALAGTTINLTSGALVIDKDLSLDASGFLGGVTIDAGGNSRVFSIVSGASVVLDSLNITGGRTPDVTGFEASAATGGGIHNTGDLTLRRVAIYGNTTGNGGPPDPSGFDGYGGDGGDGGGIFNSGELAISNSTISGNSTGDGGGSASGDTSGGDAGAGAGIFNRGTLSLTHTTISGNVTGALGEGNIDPGRSQGGGIYQLVGTLQIVNSILAGNSVPPGGGGENLYTRGGTVTEAGVNFLSGDPMLAPLGQYGGATLSMRPLTGSPVIDAAIDVGVTVTDQRGFPRPAGPGSDIGAVEIYVLDASPYPGETGVGLTPTFSWNEFPGASYEVFIDLGSGLESIGVTSSTSLRFSDVLDLDTAYDFRIDVTPAGEIMRTGDVGTFTTRDVALVTIEIDEDDGGLGSGAGDSLRELIRYSDLNGSIIRFSPSLDGSQIALTGGELLIGNQWLEIDGSTLANGVTIDAGGASRVFRIAAGAIVQMRNLTVAGGFAGAGAGGGVWNEGALSLGDCTVRDNRAARGGGIAGPGDVSLSRCTFASNESAGDGGGLAIGDNLARGSFAAENSTFSGNVSSGRGGAIAGSFSSFSLDHVTITRNSANEGGGIFLEFLDGSAGVAHSIIAGNLATSGGQSAGEAFTETGLNLLAGDPLLETLADYGGRTETCPPKPGSPAVDRITRGLIIEDQRRILRVQEDAVDLGAVELFAATSEQAGGQLRLHGLLPQSAIGSTPPLVSFEISTSPDLNPDTAAVVSVLAGSGVAGDRDGAGAGAEFFYPSGLAVTSDGAVIVADTGNQKLRSISGEGLVSTLAGSGQFGFIDGDAAEAAFSFPNHVVVRPDGTVLVADLYSHSVREVSLEFNGWEVNTLAGAGFPGYFDSSGEAALFSLPSSIAIGANGDTYVADSFNHRIRRIDTNGAVTTFAGDSQAGLLDGPGHLARFNEPYGLAIDPAGNLYVSERGNHAIRKVTSTGVVSTIAGDGSPGLPDPAMVGAYRFNTPAGIAVRGSSLYVADEGNDLVHRLSAGPSGDWTLSTLDLGVLESPGDVSVGEGGVLYVADSGHHRILRVYSFYRAVDATLGIQNSTSQEAFADIDPGLLSPRTTYYFRWVLPGGVVGPTEEFTTAGGSPFRQWQLAVYGAGAGDLSLAGPQADQDGNGVTNLIAYALNLHPSDRSQTGLPTSELSGGFLRLTYSRALAATDINLEVEWSEDLALWRSDGVSREILSTDAESALVRASVPVPAGGRRFIRFTVTLNE